MPELISYNEIGKLKARMFVGFFETEPSAGERFKINPRQKFSETYFYTQQNVEVGEPAMIDKIFSLMSQNYDSNVYQYRAYTNLLTKVQEKIDFYEQKHSERNRELGFICFDKEENLDRNFELRCLEEKSTALKQLKIGIIDEISLSNPDIEEQRLEKLAHLKSKNCAQRWSRFKDVSFMTLCFLALPAEYFATNALQCSIFMYNTKLQTPAK